MIAILLAAIAGFVDAGLVVGQTTVRERVTIRERTIIRVPRAVQEHDQVRRWRETRAPRCLPAATLAGAAISGADSIDLVLAGNRRVRARLERRCPAMDFYSGFYIRPGADGMICADRDVIRSRAGQTCEIGSFRGLVPDTRRR